MDELTIFVLANEVSLVYVTTFGICNYFFLSMILYITLIVNLNNSYLNKMFLQTILQVLFNIDTGGSCS